MPAKPNSGAIRAGRFGVSPPSPHRAALPVGIPDMVNKSLNRNNKMNQFNSLLASDGHKWRMASRKRPE
jgi:hypothetical protein